MDPSTQFLQNLPPTLRNDEQELKDAILKVAKLADRILPRDSGVPLQKWVDFRMAGDVLLGVDPDGFVILEPVGRGRKDKKDEFFSNLPTDSFTREEKELRRSLYTFLATWESKELASLSNAGSDKGIQAAKRALFPNKEVSIKEWIEQRIGGEFRLVERRNQLIIELTAHGAEEIKPFLNGNHGRQDGWGREGRGGPPPPASNARGAAGWGASSTDQPPRGHDRGNKGAGREPPPPALQPPVESDDAESRLTRQEQFFSSLPEDRLGQQELDLREEILSFLERWQKPYPATFENLGSDSRVRDARLACLPKHITLRTWVDQRIGGEVETMQPPEAREANVVFLGLTGQQDPADCAEWVAAILDERNRRKSNRPDDDGKGSKGAGRSRGTRGAKRPPLPSKGTDDSKRRRY